MAVPVRAGEPQAVSPLRTCVSDQPVVIQQSQINLDKIQSQVAQRCTAYTGHVSPPCVLGVVIDAQSFVCGWGTRHKW